jgi:hypothetical protein
MVAGDIALNVENPQIRNVDLGSGGPATINNYPEMEFLQVRLKVTVG